MLSGAISICAVLGTLTPGVSAKVSTVSGVNRLGAATCTPSRMPTERITHIANCVSPTNAIPTILPTNSCVGFTEEISTSTMRFDFSSNTPRST